MADTTDFNFFTTGAHLNNSSSILTNIITFLSNPGESRTFAGLGDARKFESSCLNLISDLGRLPLARGH